MYRSRRRPPRPRADRARGFTLIEVLVALTLAAIGMSLLIASSSEGLGNARTATRYLEATRRAQSRLAAIGITEALRPGLQSGDDGNGFAWSVRISEPVAHAAPTANATAPPPERPLALYTVEATVSWTTSNRTRQVVLQTERLGPP